MRFALRREDLELLDENMRRVLEPSVFRVLVGASSKDIRLRGDLVVPPLKPDYRLTTRTP